MATNLPTEPAGNEADARETGPLVSVRLGDRMLGVPLGRTREAVTLGRLTPIPFAPAKVLGAINLGGRMATVIDLRAALGLGPRDGAAPDIGLAVEVDGHAYVLAVDAVEAVAQPEDDRGRLQRLDLAAIVAP